MSSIKAIIFDLDGTLIDSSQDLATSVNYTLRQLQLPEHSTDEIESFVGDGVQKLIVRSLGEMHTEYFEKSLDLFSRHYGEHCTDKTILIPGVSDLLGELSGQYKLAVVTNKSFQFTKKILQFLKIDHYFQEIIGGDTLSAKKPDPVAILYLADKWGLTVDQMVMVGDHVTDIKVGINAGCRTIFYANGIGEARGLTADRTICSMTDLVKSINSF